ncbi:uncharacterized protein F4822DRAFT_161355 [Hypoxylon trugodes]|uniref:uncharacterized protein n=1 Tax=Hypoxylon trugodes TaxID=326681 RepID=UPI0021A20767|nr:uncharacterized protein F4822DRAFT_161355 [Hypoxylon trugodes]KAI1390695.1 hypothetical protein F4822DRAFT_161355 [Hypoxylon trugodes]
MNTPTTAGGVTKISSDLSTRGLSAVREYYSEFFDKLKMVRRTAEEAGRPLVLIGHGFGAAVVAKILMEAKDYEEDECLALASLYGSIKAMVLIAAPDSAMLIDQIQTMVAGDTTSPSPNLIAAIDDTVQGLAEDLHDFNGGDLWSTCDKFGKRQPSILKIPPFASTKIKVHKSMTSIARFGTSADPAYQSMVKILKEVEATAMTERSPEWINAAMIRKSGLTVIHNPPEAITDIVLIPDLTGDPWETWSQCSRNLTHYAILSKFWPASFLPKDFPETRILVWGFEPDPTFRMDAFLDRASELLHSLTMPDSRPLGRSMVFIAHSFGGILLKEMLRLADQGDTMATKDLMSYTSSVVFLGTPHGGDGDSLSLVDVVQRLIPSQYTQQEYDDRLERCQETFLTQRKTYGFRVKCFAEVPTSLFQSSGQSARYIIPKTAATLPESISTIEEIGAGSKGFCQFDDSSNAGYLKITLELQIALEQVKNDGLHLRDDCLKSLYFEQLQSRELDIAIALDSTATWLFKHRDYVDWASWGVTHTEERRGLLWIRGKPGSGKSTLMKEALTQAKVAGRRSSFSVSAFFFSMRSNVQLQKSPLGLFRTLLYDLIKQDKALLTAFITEYKRKRATNPGPWTWHQTELQNFFRSVYLRDEFSRLRNAMIFIDALDESDREGHKEAYQVARELVFYFREITAGRRLKVCLASRHYPDIEVPDCPQISVENFNGDDIIHFLNTKLHGADEDPRIKALAKRIADKAQGVFLWVVLVVETLNMNIANHMTELGLYDVLDNLPGQLEDLFESLFTNKSSKHELRVAANIFQWILLAERPLEKDELRHALTIDLEDTKPMDSPRRWSLSKDCIQEEARKFLTSLRFYTRGLAQITLKQYREPESQLHSFAERRRAKRKHIKDSASESIRLEGEEERKKRAAGDRMATKLDQRTKPGPVEGKQDNKAATGEDASDNENGEGQHNSSSSPAPISLMSILTKPFEGITDVPLPFPPPRFLPQPQPRPTLDPPSVPAHVLDSEILYKPTFMGHSTWVPTPPTLPTLDSLNNNAAQPTVMPDAPQLPLIPQDNPYRPTILPSLPSPRPKRFPRIPVRGLLNLVHEEWSSVQFIHESVREFFLRGDGFAILECNGNSKSLAERHEILAEYCMVCIYQTPWDTFGERVFDEFPFVRYALKSLLYHVGEAERELQTPLHLAVSCQYPSRLAIEALLEAGADGNAVDVGRNTVLHYAAERLPAADVKRLLEKCKKPIKLSEPNRFQRTPLHNTAWREDLRVFRVLMDAGADLTKKDSSNATPVHYAKGKIDHDQYLRDFLLSKGYKRSLRYIESHLTVVYEASDTRL